MIPEIDTQLAAVIKSLGDNVLPAVDATNQAAAEQIRLCLATITIVRARLPDLHHYLRRDLEANLALADALTRLVDGPMGADLARSGAAASQSLADPESGPTEIEASVRALKAAIVALIDKTKTMPQAAAIFDTVIAAQEPMILRSRAWASLMGFEPDATQIPALAQLLTAP